MDFDGVCGFLQSNSFVLGHKDIGFDPKYGTSSEFRIYINQNNRMVVCVDTIWNRKINNFEASSSWRLKQGIQLDQSIFQSYYGFGGPEPCWLDNGDFDEQKTIPHNFRGTGEFHEYYYNLIDKVDFLDWDKVKRPMLFLLNHKETEGNKDLIASSEKRLKSILKDLQIDTRIFGY